MMHKSEQASKPVVYCAVLIGHFWIVIPDWTSINLHGDMHERRICKFVHCRLGIDHGRLAKWFLLFTWCPHKSLPKHLVLSPKSRRTDFTCGQDTMQMQTWEPWRTPLDTLLLFWFLLSALCAVSLTPSCWANLFPGFLQFQEVHL